MRDTFTVTQPTKIVFGNGAVGSLADEVRALGGTRVFLVVDPGLRDAGVAARVTASLDEASIPYTLFDRVDPEPGLKLADAGCEKAKADGCDCVVGVGGGSAMDIAKAVSVLVTNGGRAVDYLGLGKIGKAGLPKIMVPTTAGTGSEVSFTAVFINEETRSKGGMNGDPLYPETAVLDPELTLSMPPRVTAATGIDALTHAIESFVSVQANGMSEVYSLEAVSLIADNLPLAFADGRNLEARYNMLLGSLLAGKGLALAGVGLVHAMAYPLGGMFGVPHGLANAVLLPFVMDYTLIGAPDKFAAVAEAMGAGVDKLTTREAASLAVEAVYALNRQVGIPPNLAELDIREEHLPEMADVALTVARPVENNPRQPTRDEIIMVYQEAVRGWE